MKQLTCEMCGSTDLLKQEGVFVCQSCGTKYSVEEAKKLMIEGTVDVSGSTVKVDTSAELANLYTLARRARDDNNSEQALKFYEQILILDSSSWEAYFYSVFYQTANSKVAEISIAADRVLSSEETVFKLIKNNVSNADEQAKAVSEVAIQLTYIANLLFNAYKNFYTGLPSSINGQYLMIYFDTWEKCRSIIFSGGDTILSVFGDKYANIAISMFKSGITLHTVFSSKPDEINSYIEKIKKYDSSYQAPQLEQTNTTQTGGCYVATAVYGSYDCPQVWTLRRYRDYTLAETWYGRAFIRTYYAISPTLVKWFGHTDWFKNMWKGKLDRMVKDLQSKGVAATPYEDRDWNR